MLAEETEALVHEIEAAALVFLGLTHADWDHVLGPESLPQATTVAHESYARDLDPDGIRAVLARFEEQAGVRRDAPFDPPLPRSEEHTSELQSHSDLVCRLLLEKKK